MLAGGAELELGCQEEGSGRSRPPPKTYNPPDSAGRSKDARTAAGLLTPEWSSGVGAAAGARGGATGGSSPHTCASLTTNAQNHLSQSVG